MSLANATASSAGAGLTASAGLTVVSTAAGTKGETLTIEPRRDGILSVKSFPESLLILLAVDELAFLAWLGDEGLALDELVGVGCGRLGGLSRTWKSESKVLMASTWRESAAVSKPLARTTPPFHLRNPCGRSLPATTGPWIPAGALDARGCRGKAALCIRAYIRLNFVSRAWKARP